MPRYFTGRSVTSTTLVHADARTFPDLVKTMIGLPVTLAVTQDEFRAMTKPEQSRAKDVPYLVACTFAASPHEGRLTEHARDCNLVFLDIDDHPDTRALVTQFVSSPGMLASRLEGLSFAAYQTISSTADSPRLRVMVDADSIPPTSYAQAVREVGRRLGLAHVTGESAVVTQPMFRPTIFRDSPDTYHPLLATCFDGKPFTIADIHATDLPALMRNNRVTDAPATGDLLDELAMAGRPMTGIDAAEAARALAYLSPDCPRAEWVSYAAALKHQFGDAGEDIWTEWSRKGEKFVSDEDCATNWRSLKEAPAGRSPITLRTLIRAAQEKGYKLPAPAEADDFERVLAWLNFGCMDHTEIIAKAAPRIAALRATPMQEDMLAQAVSNNLHRRFEIKLTTTAVKHEIARVKTALANPPGKETEHVEPPPWARLFVYVTATNEYFQHSTGTKLSPAALDAAYSRRLLPTPADLQAAERPVNQATLHTPLYLPTDFLLNHVQIPVVHDYCYEPAMPEDTVIAFDNKPLVNTYRRTYPKADKSKEFDAWRVMDRHLRLLFSEPESRRVMVDWIAFHVQNPGVKINWAPLIQGGEGSGKSVFTDVMAAVLGDDNVNIIAKGALDKGYNSWVMSSQVVAVEEVRISGANRHEIMDALKPLISNEKIPVVQRYRDERKVRHCANFLLYTNHYDALPVNQNTRRFWYVCSALQNKEQILAITRDEPAYFTNLFGMCSHNAAGLRSLFENHVISPGFNPKGHAPVTRYLLELAYNTANETTAILRRLVEDDSHPLIAHEALSAEAFRAVLKQEGERATPQHVANVLQEAGYHRMHARQDIGGQKHFVWHREDCENPVELLQKRLDDRSGACEIL